MFIYIKNILILLLIISFILPFSSFYINLKNKDMLTIITPASASEIKATEDLIKALENSETPGEREKILKENKDIVNSSLVISILIKASESFGQKNLSTTRSQHLGKIAIQTAEFINDKVSLGKALLYYSDFEILNEKNYNPPGIQKALTLFIEAGDRKGEALCYIKQAYIIDNTLHQPDRALELMDKAMNIFKDLKNELRQGDCYALKGKIYQNNRNKNKAIENYKEAIEIYNKQGDIMTLLIFYQEMVFTCQFNGFLEEAEKYLEMKREIIEKLEPDKIGDFSENKEGYFRGGKFESKELLFTEYYMSHGQLYSIMGKYEQAIKSYEKAIEIGSKLDKMSFSEMFAYWSLGGIYLSLGQKDRALKYYLEGINKHNDNVEVYQIAVNYMILGGFYLKQMKQPDEAIKYYELALKKSEEIDMKIFSEQYKALCIRDMGQVYEEKGEVDKAIEKTKESLKIFEEMYKESGQCDYYLVWSYDLLGKIYQKKGDKEHALEYINKALEIAKNSHSFGIKASAYKYAGDFYFKTEQYKMALDSYMEALNEAKEICALSILWEYYFSIGKTYEKLDKLENACNAYRNSIEIIENMRSEFKVEELKRDFMQDKIEVYEHMIDLLIKMNRNKDAFDYNEKARARAFLDILANQKIDINHGANPELLTKEEELKTQIQFLSSDIRAEKEKPLIAQRSAFIEESDKKLKDLKLEYKQVLEKIKLENPEYMTLISINPLSIEQIKTLLDKDTVIIEYFIGENKSYVWVIGRDNFNTVVLNHTRKDIENLVRSYRECACDNMTPEKLKSAKWQDLLKQLYNILFKDVEKYISGKTRLLIAPHRVLHYLPFQVLIDNQDKMLVEKYELAYLPSASVLKYCQDKNTMKKDKLLAFELGNFKTEGFSPILSTEQEVRLISSYFSNKEIYSGKDMTTEVLNKRGKDFDVLHFATHGLLDSGAPLFSSLVFADRRLNVYEIFDLDLKAYLVCLSACKTGLGEEANGDELVGLSRAFIYAGTPTICSSLWDVSDVSTSELMERFYFYLKDKNKTEALRLAQLDIMKKYPHPFFWAPFILIGDWK